MRKIARGGWFGILALAVSLTSSCKKQEAKELARASEPAQRASADRLADGKRLARAVADWARRWNDFASPATCEKVLEGRDAETCVAAQAALTNLRNVLAKNQPHPAAVRATAELALAAERAYEKLGAIPGSKHAGTSHTSTRGDPVNNDNSTVQGYARAARLALRHLSVYLQYGPLPIRQAAFAEYERLMKERPAWLGLVRSLREASLMEKDAALAAKLQSLIAKHGGVDAQGPEHAAAELRTNVARDVADVPR